jgi:threonylcarbamoyladenosine tRNA methylthiotransferase MtaB
MKIHFINIGCKVNFAEASRLKKMFENIDFEVIDFAEKADVILINTCTVTNNSDADSRKLIRRTRKNNPNSFIGVFGCYAQLNPNKIKELEVDAIFGINEKFNIPNLIPDLIKTKKENKNPPKAANYVTKIDNEKFDFAFSADSDSRTRGFLKLQDGCDFHCSYCAIPAARGNSRSIEFDEILPQIDELKNANYKEIVVSGINLSDYKSKSGENFYDLIELISNLDYNIRFRISSIEPQIINEKLLELIAKSCNNSEKNSNICPHFHIPLQSGSDEILQKMKRRYNTKQFQQIIDLIDSYIPNSFIGLDVISGFPSESQENFNETKNFISELNISALHCFTYSKRDGTIAAEMPNQIPKIEKKRRTNELIKISNEKQAKFLQKNIGKSLILLPEKFDSENNLHFGHTENYVSVCVKTNEKLENDFYKVKIAEVIDTKAVGILI